MAVENEIKSPLTDEERSLLEIVTAMDTGFWSLAKGATSLKCNEQVFKLLELDIPKDLSLPLDQLFPGAQQTLLRLFSDPASRRKSEFGNFSFRRSGSPRDQLFRLRFKNVQQGSEGKIIGSLEKIIETTLSDSEVSVDEELARKNEMLRQAEETARLGSWKYNFDTRQYYYSDNLLHLLDVSQKNEDKLSEELIARIIPEDLPHVMRAYRSILRNEQWARVNFRTRNVDGTMSYFVSSGRLSRNRFRERILIGTVQDITEQYLLNQKVDEQIHFVRQLTDSSVNGVLVLDQKLEIVLWNKRCTEIYGFADVDILGKNITDVFPDARWLQHGAEQTLQGEKLKIENVHFSTTDQFFEINMVPLQNTDGAIAYVFILIHDVTSLKLLNDELLRQKEFAEAVIENSESCIFVFDRKMKLKAWNRKCERFFGKKREEVLGRTLSEAFPDPGFLSSFDNLTLAFDQEAAHHSLNPSRFGDRYFDSYLVPMKNKKGDIIHIICLLNDVTEVVNISKRAKEANRLLEQKKNQLGERTAFLETLLDTSLDFIAAFDTDFRFTAFNKTCEEHFGLKKTEVIGKKLNEVFERLDNSATMASLKTAFDGKVVHVTEFKSEILGKDLEHFMVPLRDAGGTVIGALSVGHDITEIKKTAKEMERLNDVLVGKNDELNRMNAELTSFSYIASHDLQEPLRKIQAFASLILSKDFELLSPGGQDYFRRMQASAERMQQMIDGLLSFSRTNTGPKVFERKALEEIIRRALFPLKEVIHDTRANIVVDCNHEIEVITPQVELLFTQIISNALKFQQEGNVPEISITSSLIAGGEIEGVVAKRNATYCCVSVQDNGIGFAPDDAEKVFQMFYRLNGKSEYPGTGIGLAICRRIAQNHGGFIKTDSEPGKGACFHVFFPFSQ